MQVNKLRAGRKYKVSGRPTLRIVRRTPNVGEYEESVVIPSSTILTVFRENGKSVRGTFKFRDADKQDITARIPFQPNTGQYDIEEITTKAKK